MCVGAWRGDSDVLVEPTTIERAFARVGLDVEHHGFVGGFDDIIRYKTLKNLPAAVTKAADKLVPWRWAAPIIDRRYGVSAFPVGRKPNSQPEPTTQSVVWQA